MKKIRSIPAAPAQTLSVVLNGQNCQIAIYQKSVGAYLDLYVDNAPIVQGNLCLDRAPIAASVYLGFKGFLMFSDLQGTSDPVYTGFGTRYQLVYVSP
jgi:hypothetical protein